jgi:hypothetical protein
MRAATSRAPPHRSSTTASQTAGSPRPNPAGQRGPRPRTSASSSYPSPYLLTTGAARGRKPWPRPAERRRHGLTTLQGSRGHTFLSGRASSAPAEPR